MSCDQYPSPGLTPYALVNEGTTMSQPRPMRSTSDLIGQVNTSNVWYWLLVNNFKKWIGTEQNFGPHRIYLVKACRLSVGRYLLHFGLAKVKRSNSEADQKAYLPIGGGAWEPGGTGFPPFQPCQHKQRSCYFLYFRFVFIGENAKEEK